MVRRDPIYVGNDNLFVVRGIRNTNTGEYINDAVVELTLLDKKASLGGEEITGQTWPLTLSYVAGSNGDYQGTIEDTLDVSDGDTGVAQIDIAGEGLTAQLNLAVVFGDRAEPALAWTSRTEIERMFGIENVNTWADLNSNQDAEEITERILWSVDEATADARERLVDTPVDLSTLTEPSRPLRLAVTRLAGVLLYESRGVKDTADEGGTHRLSYHQKQADKYFRELAAGRRRMGSGFTTTPGVITDAEDTDDPCFMPEQ